MPKHLCYFLISLVLTGILAKIEANLNRADQSRLDQQLSANLIWNHTGLTLSKLSDNNSRPSP